MVRFDLAAGLGALQSLVDDQIRNRAAEAEVSVASHSQVLATVARSPQQLPFTHPYTTFSQTAATSRLLLHFRSLFLDLTHRTDLASTPPVEAVVSYSVILTLSIVTSVWSQALPSPSYAPSLPIIAQATRDLLISHFSVYQPPRHSGNCVIRAALSSSIPPPSYSNIC